MVHHLPMIGKKKNKTFDQKELEDEGSGMRETKVTDYFELVKFVMKRLLVKFSRDNSWRLGQSPKETIKV